MSSDLKRIPFHPVPQAFYNGPEWNKKRQFSEAEALLDLSRMGRRKPCKQIVNGKWIELNPGEFVASVRYLEQRWRWKKDTAARFIARQIKEGAVIREMRQGESVLTCDLFAYYENAEMEVETDYATEFETAGETGKRQVSDSDETAARQGERQPCDKYIDRKIERQKDILSGADGEILLRIARLLKPKAKLPRPKNEISAWKKLNPKPVPEELDLMEWFYSLPKSSECDETWSRKLDVDTLLNNWQAQCESAQAHKDRRQQLEPFFRDRNGVGGSGQKKYPPPNNSDAATDLIGFVPAVPGKI